MFYNFLPTLIALDPTPALYVIHSFTPTVTGVPEHFPYCAIDLFDENLFLHLTFTFLAPKLHLMNVGSTFPF